LKETKQPNYDAITLVKSTISFEKTQSHVIICAVCLNVQTEPTMAGIKEIARACGVSTTAVSDILNRGRQDRYRPETRDKILAAIQEMGYQPDRTAQSMRSRRTRMIGFVALNLAPEGRLENGGVYPFLVGLSHGLTPHGYHAALVELEEIETEKSENELPSIFRERFFDALVIQYGLSEAAEQLTANVAVPVLRWDSNRFEDENCLRRDEQAVTREMLNHLFALGHRRIGFLVGGLRWERYQAGLRVDHYSYAERYETYCNILREAGQEPVPLVDYSPTVLGDQLRAAKVTAVIAPETDGARATVDAAISLGWRVPEDISIASYERETLGREVGRLIGGMSYDRFALGKQAAGLLRTMLDGSGTVPSHSSLFGEWTLGQTVGPCSKSI
jgi:DNA-binding LacI/PurR family transcriptional regulator